MDFYRIATKNTKEGIVVYPDFIVEHSKDLMVRGKSFYAIWDEEAGLWSQDSYDVPRLVDAELEEFSKRFSREKESPCSISFMRFASSNSWNRFQTHLKLVEDNHQPLDNKIIFANTEVKKRDYVSRRLPYAMEPGEITAWDELVSTLYSPPEREKIEWAIGSIISGDSKKIQKFLVFYGSAGTGKSTILNIVENLFQGYTTSFDGRALGSSNATFATEVFKNNPLVAIQHDGDLSRIEDNTRLNSIIAHEGMLINEKYKSGYTARVNAFLFMGTNQPVKISDAKSGIIRRLIDVHPTGVTIPTNHYHTLMDRINFELGAIAHHCLEVYQTLGRNYYSGYRPFEMMLQTDIFFNFIEAYYDVFKAQDFTYLGQAYPMYKEFCQETGIERPLPMYKMREELRNYFDEFKDRERLENGDQVRSYYKGFNADKFKQPVKDDERMVFSLVMEETESLLDEVLQHHPAQLAGDDESPAKRWANVKTTLSDIDTRKLHWVKVPDNLICIDFDLKDLNGHKALERNLEAASAWPATYAEYSKSGKGIHLHYFYDGDVGSLDVAYAPGIEVKVYTGNSSLRRKLSRCNNVEIAHISSGLPLKQKEAKVLTDRTITSERGLRHLIERNLKKEIHPGTKPSVDFIHHILEEAYESGMKYDVKDLRSRIMAFAVNSTHQSKTALETVQMMKFASEEEVTSDASAEVGDSRLAFFDVEVYSNLFVICWKYQGSDEVVSMVNPSAHEVQELFKMKLVGFYNRNYDNHILYAASQGYTLEALFKLSQKIIVDDNRNAKFSMAYSLSYADIWDISTKRQGLKQFEIDLGIHHMELDLPWDEPVDESEWPRVVEYCTNDVRATEAVFEDRKGDYVARQILAELSGLTVNDGTAKHIAKIIFGNDKNPQKKFEYTDLSKEFPGYVFDRGASFYRDEEPGEGGYVYAEPGHYHDVALLDVASMHPATIVHLNLFGPYTQRFHDLMLARVAIKRRDFDTAREMFDGKLTPYLVDEDVADSLAYALKIAINLVYGQTSASFSNPFRDLRNRDNIVAKRGALFMIDLKHQLWKGGYTVAHIKTDSIKIPGADQDVIDFIIEYGKKYGYDFEHEATYDEFILVNDAVFVARKGDQWSATGAQFQHPYVFKELFSHEPHVFDDFCEKKNVTKGTMYLDTRGSEADRNFRDMRHLGRTGRFVPVLEGGGILYRVNDGKYYAVAGTKGHLWIDAEIAEKMDDLKIDMSYFEKLKNEAETSIGQFNKE
jgi:Family of unknown function (DUF5906)